MKNVRWVMVEGKERCEVETMKRRKRKETDEMRTPFLFLVNMATSATCGPVVSIVTLNSIQCDFFGATQALRLKIRSALLSCG